MSAADDQVDCKIAETFCRLVAAAPALSDLFPGVDLLEWITTRAAAYVAFRHRGFDRIPDLKGALFFPTVGPTGEA